MEIFGSNYTMNKNVLKSARVYYRQNTEKIYLYKNSYKSGHLLLAFQ